MKTCAVFYRGTAVDSWCSLVFWTKASEIICIFAHPWVAIGTFHRGKAAVTKCLFRHPLWSCQKTRPDTTLEGAYDMIEIHLAWFWWPNQHNGERQKRRDFLPNTAPYLKTFPSRTGLPSTVVSLHHISVTRALSSSDTGVATFVQSYLLKKERARAGGGGHLL